MDIAIAVEKRADCSVVRVSGRIDALTSDELEGALVELIENGERNIVLNLKDAVYISSAGLRVLVVVAKRLYNEGHFCLCNVSDNVMEIIETAGFMVFMTIYDDLSKAVSDIRTR